MPTTLTKEEKRQQRLLALKSDNELALFDHINDLEDKFDEATEAIKNKFDEALKALPDINKILEAVKGVPGDKGEPGGDGKDGHTPVMGVDYWTEQEKREMMAACKPIKGVDYGTREEVYQIALQASRLVPKPKNGKDGQDGKDATVDTSALANEVLNLLPQSALKDTPEAIRDKLELLSDDERLDISAVKGLENYKEFVQRIATLTTMPRGGGAVKVFVNGAEMGTVTSLELVAGANVTLTKTKYDGSRAVITIASSGGGGENFADNETPSGIINGSNQTFTLAQSPSPAASLMLFLNGMYQTPGGEDYTLVADTITFINAPLTGGILRAFYRY